MKIYQGLLSYTKLVKLPIYIVLVLNPFELSKSIILLLFWELLLLLLWELLLLLLIWDLLLMLLIWELLLLLSFIIFWFDLKEALLLLIWKNRFSFSILSNSKFKLLLFSFPCTFSYSKNKSLTSSFWGK